MTNGEQIVFTDWEIGPMLLTQIENAQSEVVIVSPYIEFWPHLTDAIERAKRRGVKFTLHFREDQKGKLDFSMLNQLFDSCIPVPILHAKLYFFDDDIIMSSMNLHQYSQQSSKEIAVRLVDPKQKDEVRKYVRERLTTIKPVLRGTGKVKTNKKRDYSNEVNQKAKIVETKKNNKGASLLSKAAGFLKDAITDAFTEEPGICIRCGDEIEYDPSRPLCSKCFKKWNFYGDPDYKEKNCHCCGKTAKTSMNKPLCYTCYKELTK